jgi:hypothetical protein
MTRWINHQLKAQATTSINPSLEVEKNKKHQRYVTEPHDPFIGSF